MDKPVDDQKMHELDKKVGQLCIKMDNIKKDLLDQKEQLIEFKADHNREMTEFKKNQIINLNAINNLRIEMMKNHNDAMTASACQMEECTKRWVPWKVFIITLVLFLSLLTGSVGLYHNIDTRLSSHETIAKPVIEHVIPDIGSQ